MEFTEIPFNLAGKIYRSAMPFSVYDPRGELLQTYLDHSVTSVVVLVRSENILEESGRDLLLLYAQKGLSVIHLPTRDFDVPDPLELRQIVEDTLRRIKSGKSVAVHCLKGVGRTGLFLACMTKQELHLTGDQAIEWVRNSISGAVETAAQRDMVENY